MKLKNIKSAYLKKTIKINEYTQDVNSDDIPIEILKNCLVKKAWIIPATAMTLKRQEFMQSNGIDVKECIEFIVRFNSEINEKCKIEYKDTVYEIKGVEDVEFANKFLVLVAERVI